MYVKSLVRFMVVASASIAPLTVALAQESNPGNVGGGHDPVGMPTYPGDAVQNPALTTGSRYSVTASTPTDENPTVAGATGLTIVHGDHSTISNDRRATVREKTGAGAQDAPG
jgi:hypothetical protein